MYKRKKAQSGLTIPRRQDFPDNDSFTSALEAFMMGLPGDPTTVIKPEKQQTLPYTKPQNNPEKLYKTPPITDLSQIPPKPDKKKVDYGSLIALGLAGIDALLPSDTINDPVVQPQMAYNQHPYGTGSQAYYDYGGKISTTGYKNTSADKNAPNLRIPSGNITMQDVAHPVLGVDNTGVTKLMQPGMEYKFPGDYVDEYPLKAQAGKRVPITTNNPNDPRLKAYQDSLNSYNNYNEQLKIAEMYVRTKNPTNAEWDKINAEMSKKYPTSIALGKPGYRRISSPNGDFSLGDKLDYTEPVQPVVYKKPQQAAIKKEQPTYEDSLKLYNSRLNQHHLKYYDIDYNPRLNKDGKDVSFIEETWKNDKIKPIGVTVSDGAPVYKKPVGQPKLKSRIKDQAQPTIEQDFSLPGMQVQNRTAPTDLNATSPYSFTYPTGSYNEQATKYFPDEASWRDFIGRQNTTSSQSSQKGATATGNLREYQMGGSLQEANIEAKRFATSRGLVSGQNTYVDQIPQYIDQATGKPYVPGPTKPRAFTVPNDIRPEDIHSSQGMHWYLHPQTGEPIDIDPSVLNQPRFRKSTQVMDDDLAVRRASMEDGGTMETVYEEGKEYDLSNEEVKNLIAQGYELKLGR